MAPIRRQNPDLSTYWACGRWDVLAARAHAAILGHLHRADAVAPATIARLVARSAPRPLGAALLAALRSVGWLRPDARVPFDVLERPHCPLRHHPEQRGWIRLAVFGIPGQGHASDFKQRQAVYAQRCAEIMRESRDLASLQSAAARAIGHPAVQADPSLVAELRAFVAQREVELRQRLKRVRPEKDAPAPSKLKKAFEPRPAQDPEFEHMRVNKAATRYRLRLEEHLANYNLDGARKVVVEFKALLAAYPQWVKAADVYKAESQVTRLADRLNAFRDQLGQLTQQGEQAAKTGESKQALWIARRLAAVNALLPEVLPPKRFHEMHQSIIHGIKQYEKQQVAEEILTHEKAVAAKIKKLGGIVFRFHKLAETLDHDSDLYKQAKVAYDRAVREIMGHDQEWLAHLMMKLDSLLDDLNDPQGRSGAQVDAFIEKVSTALKQLRVAIGATPQGCQGRPHVSD